MASQGRAGVRAPGRAVGRPGAVPGHRSMREAAKPFPRAAANARPQRPRARARNTHPLIFPAILLRRFNRGLKLSMKIKTLCCKQAASSKAFQEDRYLACVVRMKGDSASFQIANGGKKARFVRRSWRGSNPRQPAPDSEEQGMQCYARLRMNILFTVVVDRSGDSTIGRLKNSKTSFEKLEDKF
jgi:hypothetical protein